MAKRIKWPEYIPMPGRGEFCAGELTDGKRCCLRGWARVAFCGGQNKSLADERALDRFWDRIEVHVRERGKFYEPIAFNDNVRTTDKERAEVWREAAADLGYEECR